MSEIFASEKYEIVSSNYHGGLAPKNEEMKEQDRTSSKYIRNWNKGDCEWVLKM